MSNYFVKFFDAIQDRVARHELEEEIKCKEERSVVGGSHTGDNK